MCSIWNSFVLDDEDQKGALKLLFQLLCVQAKKGEKKDDEKNLQYLFSEYDVSIDIK